MSTVTTHIKTDKQLVPALRFKEFEGDYSNRILKDFTKINQGLQIPISERFSEQVEGSYFYITNEFLRKGSKKSYFIKNPTDSVICFEDDILMTRTGNTGQVVTGVHGAFHNNFFKIKFDESCEKWYLYFFLTSYRTQHKILTLAGTSTIPDLNHGDFYKLKITMPKYPEQQKIATFLSAVDEKIQQLNKKKNLLEAYKNGVMQQLFSGQLRFKDENGNPYPDWEENTFGGVARFVNGKAYKQAELLDEGKYRVLRVGNLFTNNEWYHSDLELDEDKYIDDGDLIYAWSASFGPRFWEEEKVIYHYHIWKVIPNHDVDKLYLFHAFMSDVESIKSQSQGGTMFHITKGNIESRKFNFPCVEEQQKIATYLSSIDTKIEAVNNQITQTQTFKKGLLQQMFV